MSQVVESIFQDLYSMSVEKISTEIFFLRAQGFRIFVQCPSESVSKFVLRILKMLASREGDDPNLICSSDSEVEILSQSTASKPCILVTHQNLDKTWGFVKFPLPNLNNTLPSTQKIIFHVLTRLSLERFIDCFDSSVTQQIRRILDQHGPEKAIDSIVQVALLAGLKGDEKEAILFLERAIFSDGPSSIGKDPAVPRGPEEFFGQVLSKCTEPHAFIKAALSFYAVRLRGVSITRASRHLNISRTTLIEHLRIAERLNVKKIFPTAEKSLTTLNQPTQKKARTKLT